MSGCSGLRCLSVVTMLGMAGCYTRSVTVVDSGYRAARSADRTAARRRRAPELGDRPDNAQGLLERAGRPPDNVDVELGEKFAINDLADDAPPLVALTGRAFLTTIEDGPPSEEFEPGGRVWLEPRSDAPASGIQSAGPRFGMIYVTGDAADALESKEDASPVLTAWGWQFEFQYETSPGGPTGLVELVPVVVGMDQGLFIPSMNVLFGLRTADDWEFGVGPNLGPRVGPDEDEDGEPDVGFGVGLTCTVGKTFRAGELNMPVNLAAVLGGDGARVSVMIGWNMRQ